MLIDIIVSSVITSVLTSFFIGLFMARLASRIMDSMDEEDEELILNLEFIEKSIYIYDKESDEFIVQGNSWDSLQEELRKRFPNKTIIINEKQLEQAKTFKSE